MTSDSDLGRRVRRLENETDSIYEILTEIRSTQVDHGHRLDGLDTRLDGLDTRLDGLDTRLDGLDTRLDGLDTRLDGVDGRLDGMQATLTEILRRLPDAP
jgi:chromosome segregation ATPase